MSEESTSVHVCDFDMNIVPLLTCLYVPLCVADFIAGSRTGGDHQRGTAARRRLVSAFPRRSGHFLSGFTLLTASSIISIYINIYLRGLLADLCVH